jgi:hypothetical protein
MRWEDERYVRIYTRDTPDWLAMQWQGRAVFYELSRKVDRAGFVPTGKSGNRGLAGCLHMPVDVVEVGIEELLTDGCVVRVDGGLLIRNFLEAQETRQSDAARKRSQRERDRDTKRATADDSGRDVTDRDELGRSVTNRDHASQNVTDSHGSSPAVTDGHSVPCRTVPTRTEPEDTHIARAPAREAQGEDDARIRPPPCSEADLAAVLRELPALADLADDPDMLTDLHSGFAMACGDAATEDLARSALGVLVGRESLRDQPPWKRRERAGTYLGKARQYGGGASRGSDPARVTDDQRAVLTVFGEEWKARKKRDFVQSAGDEKHAAAIVEAAWEHAGRLKIRPRDVVRHWCKGYLADGDKFIADREHPLSLLPSRLTSYGLPRPPAPKPAAAPEEPLVGTPMPPGMLDSIGAQGPRDGVAVRRPRLP